MSRVVIIDSGGANIASLMFAFERLNTTAELTTNPESIRAADRVLLPGVGAAKDAMQRLNDAGLVDTIRALQKPVLGICLGMQLLCDASEEEDVDCLGIIPGIARKLPATEDHAVPNMGWCATDTLREHPVLAGLEGSNWFYFLHSYALPPTEATFASAQHAQEFSAVVGHENFIAAQFHPERSSHAGARLLQNFLKWQP